MSNVLKGRLLKALALIFDIVPPFVATLAQFPVWVETSAEATVSGLFIVLAFISCIPLLKHIKAFIKSPSIPILWLIIFILLSALNNIIDQMIVVCFVGLISNTIGTVIYKIGSAIAKREEE